MSQAATHPALPAAPAQVPCPECQQVLPVYDALHSTHFGCPHCGAFFEQEDNTKPQILRKYEELPPQQLALPLGATGTLRGAAYQVVGYTLRQEAQSKARWEEYQLWQPGTDAYHQLALYQGHWILIEPTPEQPKVGRPKGNCQLAESTLGTFALYNRYSPRIICAQGEFDWDITEDEHLTVSEFINPPLLLARERRGTNGRAAWYLGRHVEPKEIAAAFGVAAEQLPWPNDVGAVQPPPHQDKWPVLRALCLWLCLAVVVTHLALMAWGNQTVLDQEFTSAPAAPPTTITFGSADRPVVVSPSFTVPGNGALSIDLWADVNNDWVELPFTVVNEQTGQFFEVTRGMEYYSGVEGGESWSEGSKDADALLNSVPAGRYHLNFYPAASDANATPIRFRATVMAQASFGSNAVLALLLLLLYPGILWWRRAAHEQGRWEQSDYSSTPQTPSQS
ncbi:DUF4178 domain-containing protein [Hymenobacter weizhouensis]|uniref:DUF4178 domain-containing protein n=1 Tax=Hymenobacter sp. YIM 151500-1 TaxID=2987689 RepID=UPI002227B883|nr:DUF4178 domain-containing protein [Hymenobacter sp. YIM 151500-1]UYZ64961.1 DUF4178 domain-containing protein [Hymenobacter sp. YIM 151500-1]